MCNIENRKQLINLLMNERTKYKFAPHMLMGNRIFCANKEQYVCTFSTDGESVTTMMNNGDIIVYITRGSCFMKKKKIDHHGSGLSTSMLTVHAFSGCGTSVLSVKENLSQRKHLINIGCLLIRSIVWETA